MLKMLRDLIGPLAFCLVVAGAATSCVHAPVGKSAEALRASKLEKRLTLRLECQESLGDLLMVLSFASETPIRATAGHEMQTGLWRLENVALREVRDALAGFRDLAYTSVMTVMNTMTRKKYLARTMKEGCYHYRARVSEAVTSRKMLSDLVERLFDGSAAEAMVNLLETSEIERDELARLRKLVNRKAKEGKS